MTEKNIWVSASDGDMDAVKAYLAAGVSVDAQDENGYTPLQAAVSYNQTELVAYLLAQGAKVSLGDNDDETPLHFCESVEVAELLLDAGADLNVKNADGRTPLDAALDEDNEELRDFYVNRGAESSGILSEEHATEEQLKALMEGLESGQISLADNHENEDDA
ncbi:hypothetical protein SDRG_14282 [Saprolegnia diclina VS20]|uniref:Uncharacterized protein n=1 Tax=Saprolegnia diclina (strain VS20) TaxID=1156394 RepID=T0Q3N4_SAPDV|nr:hypothetical protein SDRG_14282 [Saprolegnia diclina VS20]EQC28010.1 hypothetical protein SDRG_14282 [Saprolegnia diclina VS20]|eukprot:XP_008618623.1 hypothetical protein SDRG_14282 [Saprolegnia diclina VS20]